MKGSAREPSREQAIQRQLAEADATIAALQRCRDLVASQLDALLERRHAATRRRQNAEVIQ